MYGLNIWTQPYVHHNIRKHEVTLPIVKQKHVFSVLYLVEANKPEKKKDLIIAIVMQTKDTKWKFMIFMKDQIREAKTWIENKKCQNI